MSFDVFLSHNSKDKPLVRALAERLEARGLRPWLDEDELVPGRNWQPLLEDGIARSAAGAVLVGSDGLGPWEDEEMQAILRQAVASGKPVIPVLLPAAPQARVPALPLFLANRSWVDLREGFGDDGIDRLVWGITGKRPSGQRSDAAATQAQSAGWLARRFGAPRLWPGTANGRRPRTLAWIRAVLAAMALVWLLAERGTRVTVGTGIGVGDDAVFEGPLQIGGPPPASGTGTDR